MRIIIYGASDDLIEIGGDAREEFGAFGDEWRYLHFNDGTIVRCAYCIDKYPGWKVEKVSGPATATTLALAEDAQKEYERDDGSPSYSDCIELVGDFATVFKCDSADGPDRDEMLEDLENIDMRDLDTETLRWIFKTACVTSLVTADSKK